MRTCLQQSMSVALWWHQVGDSCFENYLLFRVILPFWGNGHEGRKWAKAQLGWSRALEAKTRGEGAVRGGACHLPSHLCLRRHLSCGISPSSHHPGLPVPLDDALHEEEKPLKTIGEASRNLQRKKEKSQFSILAESKGWRISQEWPWGSNCISINISSLPTFAPKQSRYKDRSPSSTKWSQDKARKCLAVPNQIYLQLL